MKSFSFFLLAFIVWFSVFNANAQSVGGTTSGAAIYCANDNSGFVNLDAGTYTGSIIRWEFSEDGGNTWNTIFNIISSHSYDGLLVSTCFRAIVKDGTFPEAASTMSCIDIYPPSEGGTITGGGIFCIVPGTGAGTLTLTGYSGSILFWQDSIAGAPSWTTIADTNFTLNHANLTQNTFYRAVVRNGSTCPSDTSAFASFTFDSLSVAGTIASSDTLCPGINGGNLSLTGNVGGVFNWLSSTDNINWLPISNTTALQPYDSLLQTTWYKAVTQNGNCPTDTSTSVELTIIPNLVSAGNDTTIFLGQTIQLNGTGNGTALWSPIAGLDSITVFNPTATPTATTTYLLTVTDNNSCISKDSVLITVDLLEFEGLITNLFTPNGDGINDTWHIKDIEKYPENEVFVYNIYGKLVYTKKGYTNDWQGTYNGADLPDGTYYYVLRFEDNDKIAKGSLDILRSK
ncbi:MAG: gliding motility-associated C-terminal domain-containing protein [Bacteroidetes bacterium]|nr:gliding motility-associated C-terminal domain-containing protein [Bacteroidota bacterium]